MTEVNRKLDKLEKQITRTKELVTEKRRAAKFRLHFEINDLAEAVKNYSPIQRVQLTQLAKKLFEKQNGLCAKCNGKLEDLRFIQGGKPEVDHIVPFSLGGGNEDANLQLLCKACNREKRTAFDPEELLSYLEGRIRNL